jgi:hypothetical protein
LLEPINRTLEGWSFLQLLQFHFAFLRLERVSHELNFVPIIKLWGESGDLRGCM